MTWAHRLGWSALAIVTLALAATPILVTLPEPDAAIVLDRATYQRDKGSSEVSLPHATFASTSGSLEPSRYVFDFNMPAVPDSNLFIFIPSINRRIALTFNGEPFFGFDSNTFWTGPMVSTSIMVRVPRRGFAAGRNQLAVAVETGRFAAPSYLSKIYLGPEAALAPNHQLRSFLYSQLKTMALAAQVLLGLGLIVAYFFRPKDPLFSWLATFVAVGLVVTIGLFIGWQPALQGILPFITIFAPTAGLLYVGVALALIDRPPPQALRLIAVALPFLLLPFALIDTALTKIMLGAIVTSIAIATFVAAAAIMAWGAFKPGNTDARLMLAPSFLMAWFAVRDAYVTATVPEHGYNLLFPYPRPLWLAFLTAVLMRRMGISLDQLDRSNETLTAKLTQREAELAALHRKDRNEATRLTREHERQRLTHDLHDGLSGHLVSIIALSERSGEKPTEQAARDALNDLRLVIYSLDLGDRELPLALANFRERLMPQLQRLGVELDWSTADLPEISGVTPGNALTVLRILQEAVTNALKHGPARRIAIRGGAANGMAAITVENDGRAFVESGGGHGLTNMRRRASGLHGTLSVEPIERGTRITLILPSNLPEIADENPMHVR